MSYKVRFHLGKGEHFMHWQVRGPNGYLQFYEPNHFALKMYNCILKNQRATAQKICDGENKTVCAWIACERVLAYRLPLDALVPTRCHEPISYNPKVAPYWRDRNDCNIDNEQHKFIETDHNKLYVS